MRVLASSENYLETILVLQQRKGYVRSIDIANELGFSKASVSVAMKQLRENDYLHVDEDGHIHLHDKGREIAERIHERHVVLMDGLIKLGVDPEIASEDACKLEHVLSPESFAAIKAAVGRL